MRPALLPVALLVAAAASTAACHSPGPYGHAPNYAPLSDEQTALAGSRELDPVMVQRFPEEWRKGNVSLFGVVTARTDGAKGAAKLTVSIRRLEPRNLCENANDDDTCRVTVSDRDFGVAHVVVTLRPNDAAGANGAAVGSLVRVVGKVENEADATDGAPVVQAAYYRHWPRFSYVTKSAAADMRQ